MNTCGAKKRQGDGTCAKPAGWGTDHVGSGRCRLHGGNTRSQAKRALEDAVEVQARTELARLGVTLIEDPLTELAKLAGEAVAWKDSMAAKVNELTALRYQAGSGEQLRAEIALWERALDRCLTVLTAMARLDIDSRLARITETQGKLVAAVLRETLAEAGIPVGDVSTILARRLRAVSATTPDVNREPAHAQPA